MCNDASSRCWVGCYAMLWLALANGGEMFRNVKRVVDFLGEI